MKIKTSKPNSKKQALEKDYEVTLSGWELATIRLVFDRVAGDPDDSHRFYVEQIRRAIYSHPEAQHVVDQEELMNECLAEGHIYIKNNSIKKVKDTLK